MSRVDGNNVCVSVPDNTIDMKTKRIFSKHCKRQKDQVLKNDKTTQTVWAKPHNAILAPTKVVLLAFLSKTWTNV
eukprot:700182-Amphidinium_carterae.2